MPRWEANQVNQNIHPIQFVIIILGFFVFGVSLFYVLNSPSFTSMIYFIISSTVFIYVVGRIYGLLTIKQDFIEITKENLIYRSTPAFGRGWLPKKGIYEFKEIQQVDIIEIIPFQNPDHSVMALQLTLKNYDVEIIGNNLTQDQIIRIGLALKGTVALSNSLQKILGKEDVGEQIKDIVDIGKSIWKNFRESRGGQE